MNQYKNDSIESNGKLIKIILNYYYWEKELLFQKSNNHLETKNKPFYIIDKNLMNKLKQLINYENLKEIIKDGNNNLSDLINEEDILTDNGNFKLDNSLYILEEDNILNELIKNKKFDLEIIPEEIYNSFVTFIGKNTIKVYGKKIDEKIIFEMEFQHHTIILIIFKEDSYIYNIFFIINNTNNTKNSFINSLLNQIENSNIIEFLQKCNIELNNIKNDLVKIDKYICRFIITKKIKLSLTKKKIHLINQFFTSLNKSDEKYNRALKTKEIRGNYSPCKIIDKEWMDNFIKFFNKYNDEINNNNDIQFSDLENYKKLMNNIPQLTQEKIEEGNFYILDELCLLNLFPLISIKEEEKKNFLDYQLFLINNNKGAIIINEEIYIFETKDNINKRFNYKKIKTSKKYEILYKTEVNQKYELTEENWKNLDSNGNEINEISDKEENNKNRLNDEKRTVQMNEEINQILDTLQKKEQELELKKKKLMEKEIELNNKLKEINDNKIVILKKDSVTLGLENLGATCYMNASLQCMAHCTEISEKILTWYKYSKDNNKTSKKLSYSYAEVLDNLFSLNENKEINKKYYSPVKFKDIIGKINSLFTGIQANDSKDLINFIIEKMHEELNPLGENVINNNNNNMSNNNLIDQSNELLTYNNFMNVYRKNYHSFLSEYLYAIQKTVNVCCFCCSMTYNFQAYNFLIFPLLEAKKYTLMNIYHNPYFNVQNYVLNLYDCFKYFQKIERFTGPNKFYCNKCKSLQDSNYCSLLYNTPTVLIIVLNRGKDNKDFTENVNFDTKIDLSNFIQDKNDLGLYYLIGVVVHVGDSSMNGHFFAYCRSHFTSPWYKYNDSFVSLSSENEIYSVGKPYILFYHKFQ